MGKAQAKLAQEAAKQSDGLNTDILFLASA